MKYKNKMISVSLLLIFVLTSFSCDKKGAEAVNTSSTPAPPAVKAQTPTEAFKLLYEAVKSKDTERIRQMMSKSTQGFAAGYAQQTKQSIPEVYKNGLTATTLAESLPETRDERVKDTFGAVEVFNAKDSRWENLPFVLEDGGWKLAVGDVFQDTYKSPGLSIGEMEAQKANSMDKFPTTVANSNTPTKMPPISNTVNPIGNSNQEKPKQ